MTSLLLYLTLFTVSAYAIARRAYFLSRESHIDRNVVEGGVSHLMKLYDEGAKEGVEGSPGTKPPLVDDMEHYFLTSNASWQAFGSSKLRAIYLLTTEKPLFVPLSCTYDIGGERLFFDDAKGRHYCFPWKFSVFTSVILWRRTRVLYLVHFDPILSKTDVTQCEIKIMPHLLAVYKLSH